MPALSHVIARHERLKRWAVVPAYRAAARANVFLPGPRVFANSFPKGGTHLLSSLLAELPRMMFSGVHRAAGDFPGSDPGSLDVERLRRVMRGINRGQFMTGHFPYVPDLERVLTELGFATALMLRDPRDVVVSACHYVVQMPGHDLHRRFTEAYRTDDERLMAAITGFAADSLGRGQDSIGTRLGRYLPWTTAPGVLVLRFEDVVGPSGGGAAAGQRAAVAAIAQHVSRPLSTAQVDAVAARVWNPRSSTFRQGTIGGWREHFTAEHIRAFKEAAGRELIALGYERDMDW
jgi:hypothetical protein